MSVFDVVAWITHGLAVWWAWPWLRDREHVSRWLYWVSLAVPIIPWFWLIPSGFTYRHEREREAIQQERAEQRRASIKFLREQLVDGTPLEQENAREVLALWGVPEVAPVAPPAPVVIRTTEPQAVRQQGEWLVVGGLARAHEDPPSLQRYAAGCRCPACVGLWAGIETERRRNNLDPLTNVSWKFESSYQRAVQNIVRAASIPPALPRPSVQQSIMDCPDCSVEMVEQMNASAQVCVRYVVGRTCPWHSDADIVWAESYPQQ